MKFYLVLCFVLLLISVCSVEIKTKGEEDEIIGNFENFALSLHKKNSKFRNKSRGCFD